MLLKERDIDPDIISPILGKPYKQLGRLLTVTGSGSFFLKKLLDSNSSPLDIPEDMKGIIQRYEKGLLVLLNRSNIQKAVLLPFHTIKKITIEKGKEFIRPNHKYAFQMVTKANQSLGLPVKWIAALFGLYKIEDSRLIIQTSEYYLSMVIPRSSVSSFSNYFNFPEVKDCFFAVP